MWRCLVACAAWFVSAEPKDGEVDCPEGRVISVAADGPWESGMAAILLEAFPMSSSFLDVGVNIVALRSNWTLKDQVFLNRTYGPDAASAETLEQDLEDLPDHTAVLVALKGPPQQEYLEPLSKIGAKLFRAISLEQGYGLIGRKGGSIVEHVGSWVDVDVQLHCKLPTKEEQSKQAEEALKDAQGKSPEEVGALVKGFGKSGAAAAVHFILSQATKAAVDGTGQDPPMIAVQAWRAAIAAGVSSKVAANVTAEGVGDMVAVLGTSEGYPPAELGRAVMRALRAIPGLSDQQRVETSIDAAHMIIKLVLFYAGQSEEVIKAAQKAAEDGVRGGRVGMNLESLEEWLRPEVKYDFELSLRKSQQALKHFSETSQLEPSKLHKVVSTWSKARAAEDAAAKAAASCAPGTSPEEVGARTKEAVLALGAHEAAAHLAANAAVNVVIFQAQRQYKLPAEIGAAAQVAARAAGLRGADEWMKLKVLLSRRVAQWVASRGWTPEQVGQAVRQVTVDNDASEAGQVEVQQRIAAKTAAEVVASTVARRSTSPAEVAVAAREAVLSSGWNGSSVALAEMAGEAAARAVAHRMAVMQAGWQEVAQAASEAASAALMPSAEVPRAAAEAASLEVAKAAVTKGRTGAEVGQAAIAAIHAAGVFGGFSAVIASSSIAAAFSSCHRILQYDVLGDVVDAARVAGAPGAVHQVLPAMAKCKAQEAARLQKSPEEAATSVRTFFKGDNDAEEVNLAAHAVADLLLLKASEAGGSPEELGRDVLKALKALGFHQFPAVEHAAVAAAACAVKVSLARNEPAKSIGNYAVKMAKSIGLEADKAQKVAAVAVAKGILTSLKEVDPGAVHRIQEGVLATGLSPENASLLVAETGVEAALQRCLTAGASAYSCGTLAHRVVEAAGVPKTIGASLGPLAAQVAAEHAARNSATPDEVRQAAVETLRGAGWPAEAASRAAAQAVAVQAAGSSVSAQRVGVQVLQASGPYLAGHAQVAAEASAKVLARLVAPQSYIPPPEMVQEALHVIPGVTDAPHVAAHALVRAVIEEGTRLKQEPSQIQMLSHLAAASVLSDPEAVKVARLETKPEGALAISQRRGALDEVLIKQGLDSSLKHLDAPAAKFVRNDGLTVMNGPQKCSGALKTSGISEALKQLQLQDVESLVAAAVAKASAQLHLNEAQAAIPAAERIGRDVRCAADAIGTSEITVAHVAFLSARAAASAVADRLVWLGVDAQRIGSMVAHAVRGAAPLLPVEVSADLAVSAAGEAAAQMGQAPKAVVAALKAVGGAKLCPGKKSVPAARRCAASVARHCVVDLAVVGAVAGPVTCGLQSHAAAREVLEACGEAMKHATALADEALTAAYAQSAAGVHMDAVFDVIAGATKAKHAAGVPARAAYTLTKRVAEKMDYGMTGRGDRVQKIGEAAHTLALASVNGTDGSDPEYLLPTAEAVIQAVVRRHVLQHDSPDLIAREAHLAAHAARFSDHMLLVRTALQALTDQEAMMGSPASQLGVSAKNLALALAVTPPHGMNGTEAQLLSLRSALAEAAQAAARAALAQHLEEQHGPPAAARAAVFSALRASRATGHALGQRQMARLVGRTVTAISLKQGESTNLPEILKMSVLALDPSDSELLVAAQAAAKELAKAAAMKGRHPALIHKEAEEVLRALPQDVVGPVKKHLATEAAIKAVAEHAPDLQLTHMAPLLREAAQWDPERKPVPGATWAMVERLERRAARNWAQLGTDQALQLTRNTLEQLGLPQAASKRISLKVIVKGKAEIASKWPDGCRQAGEQARQVVLSGISPEKLHSAQDDLDTGHASLSLALPAALKAAIKARAGARDGPEQMARCARAAAQGAIGKDAKTALQGQWITEAADLVASEAARNAVMEGKLPFQVTLRAEQASASLRSASPETHHSDGMAAAKAILQHGIEVSADHSETARLARVAAESSGLRIEEARHQVAEQLSSMLAKQQASLMSLDAASSRAVAKIAKKGAFDAGCEEAESAWIACHAAADAMAKTASARGASPEVVAQVALAAAEASGVPQNEAQRISAWSASTASSEQALMLGASVAKASHIALAAAHHAGLGSGTANRLAAEAAAKAVLQQARDCGANHWYMATKCKEAALAAGLEPDDASLLAASLVCPKVAETAAALERSPRDIGAAARAAAKAAGVEELAGAEEAGVAAASAAVQSALSDGVHPSQVAARAQEAWISAGGNGTTVAPCIAATAVLKRLAGQRHALPEHLASAAEAVSAEASPAAKKQVASILAKAVAESAVRRGGREEEVSHIVRKSLRDSNAGLSEQKVKEMTAMAASTAVAKAAVQQGREPAVVSAVAAKAASASGLPTKEVKDMACVASAAAIAKHSKHVRQGASRVADLVLQATRAADCDGSTPLAAAITAASRSAAEASLALHGTSAASMARAAWRAATEVLDHLGHGEEKSLWGQIVSIEAVNDWQAQAFVAGLEGHAAQGKEKIEEAIAGGAAHQETSFQALSSFRFLNFQSVGALILALCVLGLCYWSSSRMSKAIGAAFSLVTGPEVCERRTVQKFCCAPANEDTLYSALNQPNDLQTLDDDEEPLRHNVAAHALWFDREDRFSAPEKLVVILERAALERGRELVGTHAKPARPDHELQITFDALETLLDSELNHAGRLIIYLHSADDVIVEVHPGFCMPRSLQHFAKIILLLLRRRRYTGSTHEEAPAVLRVVDGPWDRLLPKDAAWYALSPQGDSVHLKEFLQDVSGSSGALGCLPASSSSERVTTGPGTTRDGAIGHVIFSIGASKGDATKDPNFRGHARQRLSICPWDLTGAACCRMLCSEFESLWDVHKC